MGLPFKNLALVILGLSVFSLSACSSNSVSEDSEDEFISEEQGSADTDAAPVEEDQLVAAQVETEAPTVSAEEQSLDEVSEEPKIADLETPLEAPPAELSSLDSMPVAETSIPASAEPVQELGGVGEVDSYSVRSGDTLMRIAFEQFGDLFAWKKIYEANKDLITDPNNIPKGVTLKIEKSMGAPNIARGDERYLIKSGDTLGTISGDIYGTPKKWKKLYQQNSTWIKDPNKIYAGFFVYYTMTPEDRQEADHLKQENSVQTTPVASTHPASSSRDPAAAGTK